MRYQERLPLELWRYWTIISILSLGAMILIARLIDLNIVNHNFLQGQGDARTTRIVNVPSFRGMIIDRNNQPLAITIPVVSIWINPHEFDIHADNIAQLLKLTDSHFSDIKQKLIKVENKNFMYLARDLDPAIGTQITALHIPGIYLQKDYRRYYPEGPAAAHILGFTNVDDHGQEGLEMEYDRWLQGQPGLEKVLKDRYGNTVSDEQTIRQQTPGQNLQLSIDNRIQYIAYTELLKDVQQFHAASGSAVVLNIKTGEILAMANVPSYDPNMRPTHEDDRYRNRAETDVFEPGSTIKSFAVETALASGKFTPNSTVNTSPGWILVDGKKVDDDGYDNGVVDLTTILKVSSNVGMTKVILNTPNHALYNTLHALGFGQITASEFPGERSGELINRPIWSPFVLATLSFGYGISVTTLQLAQAYATLANDGVKMPVSFLKTDQTPQGVQVLNPKICHELLKMLESVLYDKGGTAPAARIPGFYVTGKTGTARILGPHGYEKDHHNGMFVGIAPATNPQLVVAIMIHDAQGGKYMGGDVAAPVFSRIMSQALRLLNIPPDNLSPNTNNSSATTNNIKRNIDA